MSFVQPSSVKSLLLVCVLCIFISSLNSLFPNLMATAYDEPMTCSSSFCFAFFVGLHAMAIAHLPSVARSWDFGSKGLFYFILFLLMNEKKLKLKKND
jgi:hypothetical protein